MDIQENIDLIKNHKTVALLAPTFALDFEFPNIIGMLKHLGFSQVTELTYGARMVNWAYADYIKDHSDQKLFISSPCPTVVMFIKSQYPDMVKYLVPIVSPLAAMAKIYKKYYPDHKVVFISPCLAKKNIEAPKFKEYIDAVITLKELKEIFDSQKITKQDFTKDYYFDFLVSEYTKIYPVSGGLAATSHLNQLFQAGEILVTDGVVNIKKALDDFKAGQSQYRFMDLLNCSGGCIGGPAINNQNLPLEKKKEIINEYIKTSSALNMGEHKGKIDHAEGIDFNTTF
ncbi:MAG: [Fe-Fe] hydrogenase large subunit C-terminal domain-containing protein [Candidatus Buchananbacteria bacterium]